MKHKLLIITFIILNISIYAQDSVKVKWYSITEACKLAKISERPIFVDVYTEWCGWCKKMDAVTFSDPMVASYLNSHFYPVKLDAESEKDIVYNDTTYTNEFVGKLDENGMPYRRKVHSLAIKLLGGRMSYPTTVYIVLSKNIIAPVPGYSLPDDIQPILLYFGEGVYDYSNLFEAFKKGLESDFFRKKQ